MKQLFSIFTLTVLILLVSSCSGNKKESDVVYEYVEESAQLSDFLKERIGDWAMEGSNCYGILALLDKEGNIQEGAVIKAKIVRMKSDSIKMKSLVDVRLREVVGCDKLGISKGETWWETEGDIFLKEEDARAHLEKVLASVPK